MGRRTAEEAELSMLVADKILRVLFRVKTGKRKRVERRTEGRREKEATCFFGF
jgi:hypothetical protein